MLLTKQRPNSKELERCCRLFCLKFLHQVCAVSEIIKKYFMFVGGAELATEVPYGVVIIQRQVTKEVIQFFESITDFRWVGFVGLCVGLV